MNVWRNGHTGYFVDMAVTPIILLAVSLMTGSTGPWLHAAAAGFIAWQPFEWVAHRHILHGPLRGQHWLHHRHPTGDAGVPPFITLPLILLLFVTLNLIAGQSVGGGFFVGFGFGYWTYNLTHWAIHAGYWPSTGLLAGVARRHKLHHHSVAVNFNVLFPICDLCFGTFRKA